MMKVALRSLAPGFCLFLDWRDVTESLVAIKHEAGGE
jgi:hypothetical protein